MKGKDVNTEKGKDATAKERIAMDYFTKHTKLGAIETPKERIAAVDGFLVNAERRIVGIYEVKARGVSLKEFKNFGSWLVSYDKIRIACMLSKALQVSFVAIVLTSDYKLMVFKITDEDGNIILPCRIEKTKTQETCNGGEANRVNMFFSIDDCKVFEKPKDDLK